MSAAGAAERAAGRQPVDLPDLPGQPSGPRVVALGGGHGLAATLSALRRVTDSLTAVVTVADDGGSSGRLRRELGVLPPGDLRMALAALCGDDEWGRTWSRVVQHRFRSQGELHGHALGNLLIVALWELLGGEPVAALDWVGRLLGAQGRVLPMAAEPVDIEATVLGLDTDRPDEASVVRGQVEVATTTGRVVGVSLVPIVPKACAEAVDAVRAADWVVLGPGSWFTSVIPHLLVPELANAISDTEAKLAVVLNLAPQPGETSGFSPENLLEVLIEHAPGLQPAVVLADQAGVAEPATLRAAADGLGSRLLLVPLAADDGSPRHDPDKLAMAFREVFTRQGVDYGRI